MKKILVGMVSVAVGLMAGCVSAPETCANAKRPASPSCRASKVPFRLGVARYTMHAHTLERALEIQQNIDCHYMGLMEGTIGYDASDAEIAAYKEKCAAYGVEVVSAGPLYYDTKEKLEACCRFAKRYGMKYISVVPFEWNPKIAGIADNNERRKVLDPREWRLESDRMMDALDECVKKYDLRAAVHNHGPDNAYLYPTAEASMKRIGNRDKRIGVCLDVGHERRAGLDPAEFIRRNPDRIVEVHLKNIKIDPVQNFAKEGPRGELDIPGILKALGDTGFDGYCLVEFEKDFKVNEAPLAESFGYYRGVCDCIRVKAKMQPVPAGANALTAQERTEGFELLFDGKSLPADKWVGVKEGCTNFPAKGWFVKDGAITMRPLNGIHDGKWFPLPPEDQKLAGGGDIATKKIYKDFEFRFDFRLTEAGNSGVKYFFDENANRATCEEYQVLDPEHPDSTKGRDGNRRVAALYDLIPAHAEKIVKPTGQWNSGRIVSRGTKVEHWLNGVKVLGYDRASQAFRDAVKASKYATWGTDGRRWGELEKGRILIQDHSDSTVSFCNLKIREL